MEKTKDSCSPMRVASQPEAIGPKIWPPTLKASMIPKSVPRAAAEDPSEARTSAFVVSIRSCGGATCARAAMPRAPGEDPERDAPERGGREGASPEDGTDDIGPAGARRGEAGRGDATRGEARRGEARRA